MNIETKCPNCTKQYFDISEQQYIKERGRCPVCSISLVVDWLHNMENEIIGYAEELQRLQILQHGFKKNPRYSSTSSHLEFIHK